MFKEYLLKCFSTTQNHDLINLFNFGNSILLKATNYVLFEYFDNFLFEVLNFSRNRVM